MKSTYLLLLILHTTIISAQITFQNTYEITNSDGLFSIKQTADNGFIMAGFATNFVLGLNSDATLTKIDSNGTVLWGKTFGNTTNELASCVQQTTDGGYILAGNSQINNQHYGFLIKTNSNGDTLWTKSYGNNIKSFSSIRQTSDGGFIAGGEGNGGTHAPAIILRTDNLGNVLWCKNYGNGSSSDDLTRVADIQQTTDGGYIFGGNDGCGNCPMYLVKLNSAGDTLWTKVFRSNLVNGNAIDQTSDGGYIIAGQHNGGTTNSGPVFIKTDSNGDVDWVKLYSNGNFGTIKSLKQASNGELISIIQNNSIYALRISNTGNRIWCKKYQPFNGLEECNSIELTNDGGFIFSANKQNTGADMALIKASGNGNSGCNESTFIINPTPLSITAESYNCQINQVTTSISSIQAMDTYNTTISNNSLCNNIGLKNTVKSIDISIWPNPSTQYLNIAINNIETGKYDFNLLTTTNQKIKTLSLQKGTTRLEIDRLPPGIYLYSITFKGQQVKIGNIIIK